MILILKEDHTFPYYIRGEYTSGLINLIKGDKCIVTNDIKDTINPRQKFDLTLQLNPDIIIHLELRDITIYFTGTYDDVIEGKLLSVGEVVDSLNE